ncbi:MAG: hypothetical protein BAJATHORv1_30171 [Candidatus Thorarchaeota archaeon]|nr:MAG: hypothetical protein BAJATHORv1_30171 [Candidatus Thorarchaeota archaeon]
MIFVTVATSSYDILIKAMDRHVGSGKISDSVIAQIGLGEYEPKNMRYFRFIESLDAAYDKAEVIVSTGGAGTTLECVSRGLNLVSVENTSLMEGHQSELIGELESRGHLIWCKNLERLPQCIDEARSKTFAPFKPNPPTVHKRIIDFLTGIHE